MTGISKIAAAMLTIALRTLALAQSSANVDLQDPLQVLAQSFPKTIEFKDQGRLVEFCPDNTCHRFVRSERASAVELKDFAFLYIDFFSDFTYLEDWRKREDARLAAEKILARSAYENCRRAHDLESARCVLLGLGRGRRIRLLLVRYDEPKRNVVNEDIAEQLAEKEAPSP